MTNAEFFAAPSRARSCLGQQCRRNAAHFGDGHRDSDSPYPSPAAVGLAVALDCGSSAALLAGGKYWKPMYCSLTAEVKTFLIPMSLDNTLAIAGVSKGDWMQLIEGLVLSSLLVIFGSTVVMKIMA